MNWYYFTDFWELTYLKCLSITYLHLRHAFWHLRRTSDDLLQCGISFIHFLVFQIFPHPARHEAQHFTLDQGRPHFPFIKIALHLRLGSRFLQTIGPMKKVFCVTSYTAFYINVLLTFKSEIDVYQVLPNLIPFFVCTVSPSHGRPPKRALVFTSRVRTFFPFWLVHLVHSVYWQSIGSVITEMK